MRSGMARAGVLAAAAVLAGCPTKDNPLWGLTDGGSGGTSATTSSPMSTSAGATSDASSGTTSGTSTSSSTSTGSDGSTSDGNGGSTGGGRGVDACTGTVMIDERFDVLPEDDQTWDPYAMPEAVGEIRQGALWVFGEAGFSGAGHYGLFSQETLPASGSMGLEIVQPPNPADPIEIYLGLNLLGGDGLYFDVREGQLRVTFVGGVEIEHAVVEFAPANVGWIQIVYSESQTEAKFETSPDGETWTTVYTYDFSTDGIGVVSDGYLEFAIGSPTGLVVGDLAAVDNLYLCARG